MGCRHSMHHLPIPGAGCTCEPLSSLLHLPPSPMVMDCLRFCPATPKLSSSAESLPSNTLHICDKCPPPFSHLCRTKGKKQGRCLWYKICIGLDPAPYALIRINQTYLIFFCFLRIFVCLVVLLVVGLVILISCVSEAVEHEHLPSVRRSHCLSHSHHAHDVPQMLLRQSENTQNPQELNWLCCCCCSTIRQSSRGEDLSQAPCTTHESPGQCN